MPAFGQGMLARRVGTKHMTDIFIGTRRADDIVTGDENAFVASGRGRDTITTGAGNDVVLSGDGNDTIDAGAGNDWLFAGHGSDVVDAGDGNDVVFGGNGSDDLDGGAGSDWVDGGRGNDVLRFDATPKDGNDDACDVYLGGRGSDTLVLRLTAAQAADATLGVEIAAFEATPSGEVFTFASLGLTVHSIETLELDVIAPPVEAPMPVDDAVAVDEEGTVTFDLLANDGDVTFVGIDAASVTGVLTDNSDGTVTFQASGSDALAAGETATESFTYTVAGPDGRTATATATITITGTNDAPQVTGSVELPEADEDTSVTITAAALLAGASDVDDALDTLSVTGVEVLSGPDGTLVDDGDGTFTFTPAENVSGTLTLGYSITDGKDETFQNATLQIVAVNDAVEVGAPIANASSDEDTAVSVTIPTSAFIDVDGDLPTLMAALADGSALPAWLAFDGTTFTGTPPANFNGTIELEVTASDGPTSAAQRFTLTIDPVNDPVLVGAPLADVSSDEDTAFSIAVPTDAFTDADGDAPTLAATLADGSPLPAWIAFDGAALAGTPPTDFNGTLDIRVTATDGPTEASQDVTLTIEAVNDAPTAPALTLAASDEDAARTITAAELLAGASDVDGDALIITAIGNPITGVEDLGVTRGGPDNAIESITVDPTDDLDTAVSFDVVVSDGETTTTRTVSYDLTPVNDAPIVFEATDGTFTDLPPATPGGPGRVRFEIDFGASDVDGDDVTFTFAQAPGFDDTPQPASDLDFSITTGGTVALTYADDLNGEIEFTVQASDGNGGTDLYDYRIFRFDIVDGTDGADVLTGTDRWEELNGLGGDDTVTGGGGTDFLYGGEGNDTLLGGTGDDDLYGEGGNDVLTGGEGFDFFAFDLVDGPTGADTITDFDRAADSLLLLNAGGLSEADVLATEQQTASGFEYTLATGTVTVNVALQEVDIVIA